MNTFRPNATASTTGLTGISSYVISNFSGGSFGGSYQPVIKGQTANPVKGTTILYDYGTWRRIGDSCEVFYNYAQTNAGSGGSGAYLFPLPSTFTINQTILGPTQTLGLGILGPATSFNGSNASVGYVNIFGATQLTVLIQNSVAPDGLNVGGSFHTLGNATQRYSFHAVFPVTGWSSTD